MLSIDRVQGTIRRGDRLDCHYEKWSGLGNDFILMESLPPGVSPSSLCDGSWGLSADGLLLVTPPGDRPARMIIYNRDGSRPEMCGNGLRCAVRSLQERGFALDAGIDSDVSRHRVSDHGGGQVRVTVGQPAWWAQTGPHPSLFEGAQFFGVDVGNPHAVFFDPDLDVDLVALGTRMQSDSRFPQGTNVHLVQTQGADLLVRHFERGVGITQACGTGAAAVAWAGVQTDRCGWPVQTHLPGGCLEFDEAMEGGLWMAGPAERLGHGTLSLG